MKKHFTLSVLLCLMVALTACAGGTPEATEAPAETPADAAPAAAADLPDTPPSDYSESPMLAEQVNAGSLPPIEERLPGDPFLVGPGVIVAEDELPDWEPGRFGGTMRFAHGTPNWNPDIFIMMNEHLLMAPGIGVDGIRGNVVKDLEVSDNNQVFTFHMREGLRWSDGEPVTTEDVRFTVENIYLNEEITSNFPSKFKAGGRPDGEPMTVEYLDDYTFRVSFAEPYGGFLRELSIKGWQGYTDLLRPAHHLKQFHPDFTPLEELQPQIDAQGLEDEWWQFFNQKDCTNWELTRSECANYPVLYPWVNVTEADELMKFVRNPYYFKVDVLGQQLPYIDEVTSSLVGDVEAVNIKVLAGEIDLLREDTALLKLPLYKEAEAKELIQVALLDNHVVPTALFINFTYDDPVWQEVIGNVEFRRAINLAINRPEIIESIYFGFASPPALVPGDYNVEEANQILDSIGMDARDADGFRLGPDGNTFIIPIDYADNAPDIGPVSELIVEHFKEIGIKTTLKQVDTSLLSQRSNANEVQARVFWSVEPMWPNGTWTDYVPTNQWAPMWRTWYNSGGSDGIEPPDPVKRLYELHEGRIQAIPASDEDLALKDEIYQIHHDNIYVINIAEKVNYALVTHAKMGNVQSSGQAIGANNSGEQMFYRE